MSFGVVEDMLAKEATDRALDLGGFWHADVTYRARPRGAGLLYSKECPSRGGDTMFANQYLAFETLSVGMQEMLEGLNAVHSSAMEYGGEAARFAAVTKDHVPEAGDRKFSNITYVLNDYYGERRMIYRVAVPRRNFVRGLGLSKPYRPLPETDLWTKV